jgi:hypothetical protein
MLNERICSHCGKPIHNARSRQKYHVDCAKTVKKEQMREWYFDKKISKPNPCQRATPEAVAVALGYDPNGIDGITLLMCSVISRAIMDYDDLCNGKIPMKNGVKTYEYTEYEIERFFKEIKMPSICDTIKRINSK